VILGKGGRQPCVAESQKAMEMLCVSGFHFGIMPADAAVHNGS
jgi:hypothetical protein